VIELRVKFSTVRPLIDGRCHSGSPFRQMLESPEFRKLEGKFIEFAAQGSQCSAVHSEYVLDQGGSIEWLSQLQAPVKRFTDILEEQKGIIFVSFDIDSITGGKQTTL
jgi:formiminoglutamase